MPLAGTMRWATGRFACLWLLAWGFALAPLPAMADHKAANVLVIYSNGRLLPANVEADRGLREALSQVPPGVRPTCSTSFSTCPGSVAPNFVETMSAFLRGKYAARAPDVIVAAGPRPWPSAWKRGPACFPVFRSFTWRSRTSSWPALGPLPADVSGIPIVYEFARTIEQALAWHPKARHLVLVTGTSPQDREWEAQLRREVPRLKGRVRPEFLAGLPTPALKQRLAQLKDDSVVLAAGYFRDGDGRDFTPREAVLGMTAASGAPVYASVQHLHRHRRGRRLHAGLPGHGTPGGAGGERPAARHPSGPGARRAGHAQCLERGLAAGAALGHRRAGHTAATPWCISGSPACGTRTAARCSLRSPWCWSRPG